MHNPAIATLLAAVLAAAPASAHYSFTRLIVNGQLQGGDNTYIRNNYNGFEPAFVDEVINSPDLRCNKGAANMASQTFDVKAGDTVGFKLFYDAAIGHPGPGFIYMSRAPGSVSSYDGSGDWFKVWQSGLNGPAGPGHESNWGTYGMDTLSFTIPRDIPDGEYLARPEHIAIHEGHVGRAQFYTQCAQLRITGGGNGRPGPTVKIPGLYTPEQVNFNMWGYPEPNFYAMPGPAVWTGGAGFREGDVPTGDNSTDAPTMSAAPVDSYSAPVYSSAPSSAAEPIYSIPANASSTPSYGTEPAYSAAPSTMATVVSSAAPTYSVAAADAGDCDVQYI